jgi:hypothetical protein
MRSLPPSIRITQRARARDRLGRWCADPGPDPSVAELLALAHPGAILLTGGEPTLRADLPALLAALRDAGSAPLLDTDGAALGGQRAWSALTAAGLAGLRLRVHALQPDAHDYLEGQPGALRRSLAALKMASEAGLPVEIETALSRPTAPSLPGLVSLPAPRSPPSAQARTGPASASAQPGSLPRARWEFGLCPNWRWDLFQRKKTDRSSEKGQIPNLFSNSKLK